MSKKEFRALDLVRQHPFVGRFVTITLIIIALFIAFLFLPWQQTVKASAELIAYDPTKRPYGLLSPIDGFVKQYFVQEGQEVKTGDLLVELRDLDPKRLEHLQEQKRGVKKQIEQVTQALEDLQRQIDLQIRIKKQERSLFEKKRSTLLEKARVLRQKLQAMQERLDFAKRNFRRYKKLAKSGAVSQKLFEQWRRDYLSLKADFADIEAKIRINANDLAIVESATEQKLAKIEATIESLQIKMKDLRAKKASLVGAFAKIKSNIGRFYHRVYAKEDGIVVRILKNNTNHYVKKGDPLLEFTPKTDKRVLRVKVSDFNMPLIRKGLKARIIFYGWPAMQVSGWPKISKGTYGGVVVLSEPLAREDGSYYFLLAPDPDEDPWPSPDRLKIGTKATVWVLLDIVPIWYELWRVMMALPPNMAKRSG